MTLFFLFVGFSLAVGVFAWWLSGLDALLLILFHPVLWALVALAVAGVMRAEGDGHR